MIATNISKKNILKILMLKDAMNTTSLQSWYNIYKVIPVEHMIREMKVDAHKNSLFLILKQIYKGI